MDDLVTILGVLIALILFGLAIAIVADRARSGWRRAEGEKSGRQYHLRELELRLEQAQKAIAEQRPLIQAAERQLADLKSECDSVKARLDATELPFVYTAVPLESRDMYARSWRFTARHPMLGTDLPHSEPAGQWDQGRTYILAAENQAEARSVMDRLLPRQRGFVVVNAGEAVAAESPAAPA